MQYAVQYRVAHGELHAERARLEEVYTELAAEKPSWLACASFLLDEIGSMLLLIATDTVDRLAEMPNLATYLHGLDQHCEGEPRAGALEFDRLDIASMTEVGSWDPARGLVLPPGP